MPERKGSLRIAIEDFLKSNPVVQALNRWNDAILARSEEYDERFGAAIRTNPFYAAVLYWPVSMFGVFDALVGAEVALLPLRLLEGDDPGALMAEAYERQWRKIWEQGIGDDLLDFVGTTFSEPVLTAFEDITVEQAADPRAFIRRFHGVLINLSLAPRLVTAAIEAAGAGQLEEPGNLLNSMYWNFGLGFLGWQTIAPLLEAGMQAQLDRHYKDRFRPSRFSAGDLRDLYALGELTQDELAVEARFLGWREEDISKWIRLAFRTLNQGEVWDLFHAGEIDEEQVVRRLRALGYAPDDIPLLFAINEKDAVTEGEQLTLSTARRAFRENLISREDLRQAVIDLGRTEREAGLIVELEVMRKETEFRSLTTSQIRRAWEDNLLSDAEAEHWLAENEFGPAEVDVLLRTWQAEVEPEFRRLNKGTIVGAYVEGILDRVQAANKLVEVGLQEEDARLELDLAEARNPELFGAGPGGLERELSPAQLKDLFLAGILDLTQLAGRLVRIGFSDEDAALLVQAAEIELEEEPIPLTRDVIAAAYVGRVIGRDRAVAEFIELGLSDEDAVLTVDTIEARNPQVFAPETVQTIRQPTVGALVEALRSGIVSETEFFARMRELGFDRSGAEIYLSLSTRQVRRKTRTLTPTQIGDAFERDFVPYGEALRRLMEEGYSNADAILFLRLKANIVSETEPWKQFIAGLIPPTAAFEQLFAMGFTEEEINQALEEFEELQSPNGVSS